MWLAGNCCVHKHWLLLYYWTPAWIFDGIGIQIGCFGKAQLSSFVKSMTILLDPIMFELPWNFGNGDNIFDLWCKYREFGVE